MTATPAPGRYTWSRVAANPSEHVADPTEYLLPLCGASISAATQHIASCPSGLAPLCPRCQRHAVALTEVAAAAVCVTPVSTLRALERRGYLRTERRGTGRDAYSVAYLTAKGRKAAAEVRPLTGPAAARIH